jgi:hypothetical protein
LFSVIFKNIFAPKQRGLIVAFMGLAFLLIILSLPPFLTVNGSYLYLPS